MKRGTATRVRREARKGMSVQFDAVRATSYDEDGFLGVQLESDGVGNDNATLEAQTVHHEAIQPLGIIARSPEAVVDDDGTLRSAGQALSFWEGSEAFVLQVGDPRLIPGLATLRPGESQLYGSGFNYVRCHADGRISTMATTDATANGRTVSSEVGPAGFSSQSPWGRWSDGENGWHYRHRSGARLDIGGIAGLPSPLDALGSYATLEANIIELKGKAMQLGVGTFEPSVKALAMLTVLGADATDAAAQASALAGLQAFVVAAQVALAAVLVDLSSLLGGPQNTASSGPIGALNALAIASGVATSASIVATSAFTAACTAATTTIPASCVQVA